jgi:crotonobetainyl-CoA:carnitine CoA-transferase CaiB-like acyl-CoA transferase
MLLSDVLIVDATDRLGWLAGRTLADLGADVVKIDRPGTDRSRPHWRAFNVNKRVLDFDPAKMSDQKLLDDLLAKADICLLTPAPDIVGGRLDAEHLRSRYPSLERCRSPASPTACRCG